MRTDDEVTAAAERTAEITLRLVRVTRERDEALAAVERVRVVHARTEDRVCRHCEWPYPCPTAAALGERP